MKLPIKKIYLLITLIILISFFICKHSLAISDSSSLTVSLDVLAQPPTIMDVRVYDITKSTAKIEWNTDMPAKCILYYGTSSSYSQSRVEQNYLDFHYFNLTQLSSGTIYHFDIVCANVAGDLGRYGDHTFKTEEFHIFPTPPTPVPPTPPGPTPPTPPEEISPVLPPPAAGIIQKIAENPIIKDLAPTINVLAVMLAILAFILPAIMNIPMLAFWDQVIALVFSFFGWQKKRKNWGVVYDSESGQPVPLASVLIFDNEENKLLQTVLTDIEGRYGFIVSPGKYHLKVIKKNYTFPSKTKTDYTGGPISITDDSVITANIFIDPDTKKLISGINILEKINRFFDKIRIPVIIFGTLLALVFYLNSPDIKNTIILLVYVAMWAAELYRMLVPHSYGGIYEKLEKHPIGLTVIRVIDEKTGKLAATKVSDSKGRFYYLVAPGKYTVKATKENYQESELNDVQYKRGDVLKKDIYLKKK